MHLFDFGANRMVPVQVGWPVLGWSPDGCRFIAGNAEVVDISTLQQRNLITRSYVRRTVLQNVSWSPQGDWIAYIRQGQAGEPEGIFATRLDGSQQVKLGTSGTLLGWSQDGNEVLFWATQNGVTGLYAVNIGSLKTRNLAHAPAGFRAAAISPNGRYLIVTPEDPELRTRWKLYLLDIQTSQLRPLHEEWFSLSGVSWAPDSKRIAFGAKGFDQRTLDSNGVYLMDINKGTNTLVAAGLAQKEEYVLGYPAWSPDGKKLALLGLPSAWIYDLDTKRLENLLPAGTLMADTSWYSPMVWSPKLHYTREDCQ